MSQPIELSVIAEPNGQPRWTELAKRVESSADDVRHAPYVLVGAVGQIVEQLQAANERWGIRRGALRAASLDPAERVIARLHG